MAGIQRRKKNNLRGLERIVRAEAQRGLSMRDCEQRTGHDRSRSPEESRRLGDEEWVGRCCRFCGLWKGERRANATPLERETGGE